MEPWMLIVLLGAVIVTYGLTRSPNSGLHNRSDMTGEIEETLDAFALQLEEENQHLLRTIGEMKREYETRVQTLTDRMNGLEKQVRELSERTYSIETQGHSKTEGDGSRLLIQSVPAPASEPASESEPEKAQISQFAIKGRYKEIIDYHENGKSIEFIAKKMGMNKGEIQLIIQLAKQEEQFRV